MCLSFQTKRHQRTRVFWSRGPHRGILLRMKCLVPCEDCMCLRERVNQPEKSSAASVIGPLPTLPCPFPLLSCRHKASVPRGSCQPQQPGSSFLEESHLAQRCSLRKEFRSQTMPSSLSLFPAPFFCLSLTLFFFYKGPEWRHSAGFVQRM